ncbi:MAG: hypothetical protein WCC39_16780 [Telluria sp.]
MLSVHVEKIRFDEVFDVVAHRGSFSFRSGNRTHYGARLQNHLIPRPGATFAIAFAEPDQWSTVLGWRELASAEVTLARPAWHALLLGLGDIACVGMVLIAAGLLLAGAFGALAAMLALACMTLFQYWRARRRNGAVEQALLVISPFSRP